MWTFDELAAVEGLIGELGPLAPAHAADYGQRLLERFRQDFADIRALSHLGEEDATRYRANARALGSRQPGVEKELLNLLEKRLNSRELIEELKPPFAAGRNPFVHAEFRVADNALFRTTGRNPIVMLKAPAGSGMRIEAQFDRSWADAETVGVYLNADRSHPTEVRSLAFEEGLLASAGKDGIFLWKVQAEPGPMLLEHPGSASCVALGGSVLAAGVGREVLIWDVQAVPPKQVARFEGGGDTVLGIALTRDGR